MILQEIKVALLGPWFIFEIIIKAQHQSFPALARALIRTSPHSVQPLKQRKCCKIPHLGCVVKVTEMRQMQE